MYNYISTSHDRKVHDLDMQVYTSCASAPVLRLVWPVLRAPGGSLCLLCGYSDLLTAGQQSCQDKMTATDTSQRNRSINGVELSLVPRVSPLHNCCLRSCEGPKRTVGVDVAVSCLIGNVQFNLHIHLRPSSKSYSKDYTIITNN